MRFFRYTRAEERSFLDSSFEQTGDGYFFYRHHLARGIPVSAEERESYLRPPLDGSRRDFYRAIEGRAGTGPRRPWLRSQRATLAAVPPGFGFGLILLGATLSWRGSGFEPPLRWLLVGAGGLAAVYGALVLAARLSAGNRRQTPAAITEGRPRAEKQFECRRFD